MAFRPREKHSRKTFKAFLHSWCSIVFTELVNFNLRCSRYFLFWPQVYQKGSLVIAIGPSVGLSACLLAHLEISQRPLVFLNFAWSLGSKSKKVIWLEFWKEGFRGIKRQNLAVFNIFSETGYQKYLHFYIMLEGSMVCHLSTVPYLGKISIWCWLGV